MRKTGKIVLFLLLVVLTLVSVTACGGNNEPQKTVESIVISNADDLGKTWYTHTEDRTINISFKATGYTAKDVVITSDNTEVIAVDGKKLKAVSAGTATITAKLGDKKAELAINITELEKPTVSAEKTTFVIPSEEVFVVTGLSASSCDGKVLDDTLTLSCDDDSLIIDGLTVKAAAGTYTVKATATDGRGEGLSSSIDLTFEIRSNTFSYNNGVLTQFSEDPGDDTRTYTISNGGFIITSFNVPASKNYYAEAIFDVASPDGNVNIGMMHSAAADKSEVIASGIDLADINLRTKIFRPEGADLNNVWQNTADACFSWRLSQYRGLDVDKSSMKIAAAREDGYFHLFVNDIHVQTVTYEQFRDIDTIPGFFGYSMSSATISELNVLTGNDAIAKVDELVTGGAFFTPYVPDAWAADSLADGNFDVSYDETNGHKIVFNKDTCHFNGGMFSPYIYFDGDYTLQWNYKSASKTDDNNGMTLEVRPMNYGDAKISFGFVKTETGGKANLNGRMYEIDESQGVEYTLTRNVFDKKAIYVLKAKSVANPAQIFVETVEYKNNNFADIDLPQFHNKFISGEYTNFAWDTKTNVDKDITAIEIADKSAIKMSVFSRAHLTVKATAPFETDVTGTVMLTSDNEKIIKVENGVLVGVAEGTAVITAKYGAVTDSVEITVGKYENVTLTGPKDGVLRALKKGDEFVRIYGINALFSDGSDISELVEITSTDASVAFDKNTVLGEPGEYPVTVTLQDPYDKAVTRTLELTLSIEEKTLATPVSFTESYTIDKEGNVVQMITTYDKGFTAATFDMEASKKYYAEVIYRAKDGAILTGDTNIGLAHHKQKDAVTEWLGAVVDTGDPATQYNAKTTRFVTDGDGKWSIDRDKIETWRIQYYRGIPFDKTGDMKLAIGRDGDYFYFWINGYHIITATYDEYRAIDTVPGLFVYKADQLYITGVNYCSGAEAQEKIDALAGANMFDAFSPADWGMNSWKVDKEKKLQKGETAERGLYVDYNGRDYEQNDTLFSNYIFFDGDFTYSWEYELTDSNNDGNTMLADLRAQQRGSHIAGIARFVSEGTKYARITFNDAEKERIDINDFSDKLRFTLSRKMYDSYAEYTFWVEDLENTGKAFARTYKFDGGNWNSDVVVNHANRFTSGKYSRFSWKKEYTLPEIKEFTVPEEYTAYEMDEFTIKAVSTNPAGYDITGMLTYESADDTVAEVTGGVIKALKAGETVITVKCGETSHNVNVKVVARTAPTLDTEAYGDKIYAVEGENEKIFGLIAKDCGNKDLLASVVLSSEDEGIAFDGMTVTAASGEYTVTATVTDPVNDKLVTTKTFTLVIEEKLMFAWQSEGADYTIEYEFDENGLKPVIKGGSHDVVTFGRMNVAPAEVYYAEADFVVKSPEAWRHIGFAHFLPDDTDKVFASYIDLKDVNAYTKERYAPGVEVPANEKADDIYSWKLNASRRFGINVYGTMKLAVARDGDAFHFWINGHRVHSVLGWDAYKAPTVIGLYGYDTFTTTVYNYSYMSGAEASAKIAEVLGSEDILQEYVPDAAWASGSQNIDNRNFTSEKTADGWVTHFTNDGVSGNSSMISPYIYFSGDFTFSWVYKVDGEYDFSNKNVWHEYWLEFRDNNYTERFLEVGAQYHLGHFKADLRLAGDKNTWRQPPCTAEGLKPNQPVRYTVSRKLYDDRAEYYITIASVSNPELSYTILQVYDDEKDNGGRAVWNASQLMHFKNQNVKGTYSEVTYSAEFTPATVNFPS